MSKPFSFLHSHNAGYIDQLFESYQKDPDSIDRSFRHFFEGIEFAETLSTKVAKGIDKDLSLLHLLQAYRRWGHLEMHCNPLQQEATPPCGYLDEKLYGFSEEDRDKEFNTLGLLPQEKATLDQLIQKLRSIYCSDIGVELSHFENCEAMHWLFDQIEHPPEEENFTSDQTLDLYAQLVDAEQLEIFIHKTYPYITRFSVEGGESLLPLMQTLVNELSKQGAEEMVVGMSHRGRINFLANVMKKPLEEVFYEFEPDYQPPADICGDLKYHNGFVSQVEVGKERQMQITLLGNPSHLESIDPIAAGAVRAHQELKGSETSASNVVPLAVHGDASFAGQGVVYETMQMSQVKGFFVGGTIHIVVNNQIGYTASSDESRSTLYATEIARAFSIPVLHVNGENVLACARAARIAAAYRQKFGKDIVIDYNCYRRIGHNESDEVTYTNPVDYKLIKSKPMISEIFRSEQKIADDKKSVIEKQSWQKLSEGHQKTAALIGKPMKPHLDFKLLESIDTQIDKKDFFAWLEKSLEVPDGFNLNPKLKRILDARRKLFECEENEPLVDWGTAEMLAFASLLTRGKDIRVSGQDSIRGTFSSRHAALYDVQTQELYFPLQHLSESQGNFRAYNSILSEYGTLGFELGFSIVHHNALTLWEAQYGDFFNGAQIVFDQYISAIYDKWEEVSSLVMLLPHGMEGKGAEHSSARMERHLQLCAKDNMYVVTPSTPAQYFHLLCRQVMKERSVPLIVFTPKAHLRFSPTFSTIADFTSGSFEEVIDDTMDASAVESVLLCTGHVYYDLLERRKERGLEEKVAIVRIEQLYPLHEEKIRTILNRYGEKSRFVWVQEEHRNQGAYAHICAFFREELQGKYVIDYVGRDKSPAAAAGYSKLHKQEQEKLLDEAFQ